MNTNELLEDMQHTIYAIGGIQDLLSNQTTKFQIPSHNLYFLLGMVIEKQNNLVDQLHDKLQTLR